MSDINVIPNSAANVAAQLDDSFSDWASRVNKASRQRIAYEGGAPIEMTGGNHYSFMMFEMERLLTAEEFAKLFYVIKSTIETVTDSEGKPLIAAGLIKNIGTPFNFHPPELPEQFHKDDHEYKVRLSGEFRMAPHLDPTIPEVEMPISGGEEEKPNAD